MNKGVKMSRRTVVLFLGVVLTCLGSAQMAPRETVTAQVGAGKVSIEYGRPSLKGRTFDELISKLPDDRIWRAGSEQITTLTTEGPLMVGGKMIPPGKYSLYVHCPEGGTYSLAVNKTLGQPLKKLWSAVPEDLASEPWPHMNYEREIRSTEVARIPMKQSRVAGTVDLFTIKLEQTSNGAVFNMTWGNQSWNVDINPARADGWAREGS
jgi:hypothetical protein